VLDDRAVMLAACGATDDQGGVVAVPAEPSAADSQSALNPSADADPARSESVAAVRQWLGVGGTGTADNYDAERPVGAPSAATIDARFGWGTILDEADGWPGEQGRPEDQMWVCQNSFPPPEGCEFPLGEVWVKVRADNGLPQVVPDLYGEHLAILGQPGEHAGERVSLYVYVPLDPRDDCPEALTGQILLGLEDGKPDDGESVGENGGAWFLYAKSQRVRFVVNGPVDGQCSSPGDLMKILLRVEATVMDEPSPAFRVQTLEFIGNEIDEVPY
jgi:hypothetical protein